MRRWCLVGLLLVALVAATASATAPVVPRYVQQGIDERYRPELRYLPTRLPTGFQYAKWRAYRLGFDIYFKRGRDGLPLLGFHVLVTSCANFGGQQRTLRIGGVTVFWSATHEDQQAWRCLSAGRLHFVVSSSSVGNDLSIPKLARLVVFARRND
jgi:hypothetical protein